MGILARALETRNMSQRDFQRLTDEIAARSNGRFEKGVSQGALSNYVNNKVDTEIRTMALIAQALAEIDASRTAGEWLFSLIVEAGYPLAQVTPEDVRRWTEETLAARDGEPQETHTVAALQRVRQEIDNVIRRLRGQ